MKLNLSAGLAAGIIALSAASALAAPVTVTLRVEGPTKTVFEGPVTTDARAFHFTGGADHACGAPGVTRGAVFAAAEDAAPFSAAGTWDDGFGSPTFSSLAGESVAYDAASGAYLGEYINGKASDFGACGETVADGDQVLFAYGPFGAPLLSLSGAAVVAPGATATLKVTDATGAAVAGAAVAGATSAPDGTVTVGPFADRGDHLLKATKDGAIRSNAVDVCVSDGTEGQCGTKMPVACACASTFVDTAPPVAKLAVVKDGATLKTGPRELKGSFLDQSSVQTVKLRLTKRLGARCWYFSGKTEQFRGTKCGTGPYFAIDTTGGDWSYLLPSRLTKGRYVLDAIAIDTAGNRTPLARGTTRVVFTVR